MKITTQGRVQRARALLQKTRALLAVDRYAEAVDAVREARRLRAGLEAVTLGLHEAEALLGAERAGETVDLATRLLALHPPDADERARLRVARAHALLMDGRVVPARRDAQLAETEALTPITRGRVLELFALLARHDGRHQDALRHLESACALYEGQGYMLGVSRAIGAGARVLRDNGRFAEAARLHERWHESAATTTRRAQGALAHVEQGQYLLQLGHWTEARGAADSAAQEFRRHEDPREHTQAGVLLARVLLAEGDFAGARQLLARARLTEERHPSPRLRAEVGLHWADLELALGDAAAAQRAADESLALFDRLRDADGLCRARFRRVHALLEQGALPATLREAHRAARLVPAGRPDLETLAHLAHGRVLARAGKASAADVFALAHASALPEHGYAHAARLGLAVARGRTRDQAEIADALAGLERWGDRRLVALCLHDLQRLQPLRAETPAAVVAAPETPSALPSPLAAVVEASCRLRDGQGWVAAARAFDPVLPWRRLLLVGSGGWELAPGRAEAVPLPADDPWFGLARGISRPSLVRHAHVPALEAWPATRLHGLVTALVAPSADGGLVVAELAGEPPAEGLDYVRALARLLPAPEPPPAEALPSLPGFVAGSEPMRELLRAALPAARHGHAAVHLFGETGSGKEKVAELIHRHSPRTRGPFVALNVAAIQDGLLESEMFGAAKGAYTGAVTDRPGYVEIADGGTLFLDEIAELSKDAQAKLLRFLQSREYRRVGDPQVRRADVRIVTAANVRLTDLVKTKRFREDLWYRLEAIVLDVPPLRVRGDDVVRLAKQFLRGEAARAGVPAPELSSGAARALKAWAWPGNVRELENEMTRAVVKAGKGPIGPEHLSPHLRAEGRAPSARTLREMATDAERAFIAETLARHEGNRARTARVLGLSRQALVTKIGRLGLV